MYPSGRPLEGGDLTQTDRFAIPRLTNAERERGLRALERLEQLDRELLEKREGKPFLPTHELHEQIKDERKRAC